jgi:excisionase family DNA binding protein
MFDDYPDILTVREMQALLGIGKGMAYKIIKSGAIKHMRLGKVIKIPKKSLIDYVCQQCYHSRIAVSPPSYPKRGAYDYDGVLK